MIWLRKLEEDEADVFVKIRMAQSKRSADKFRQTHPSDEGALDNSCGCKNREKDGGNTGCSILIGRRGFLLPRRLAVFHVPPHSVKRSPSAGSP